MGSNPCYTSLGSSVLQKLYPTYPSAILYDLTDSMTPSWRPPKRVLRLNAYILAYRQHRNEIANAMSMFSRFTYAMELRECGTT